MSKLIPTIIFLQLAFMLAGCESTGTIRGVSEAGSVKMNYKQEFDANDGTLKVTMPSGETFSGKFVQKSSSKSGDELLLGKLLNADGNDDDDSIAFNDSTTVSSQAEALLIGNKGHTMKCKFQLSDPESGIDGGGIGSCKVSNGKTINMTF